MKYPNAFATWHVLSRWPDSRSTMFAKTEQNVTTRQITIASQYVRDPIYLERYEALEKAFAEAAKAKHLSTTSTNTRTRVVAAVKAATLKSKATVDLIALEAEQAKHSANYVLQRKQSWLPLQSAYVPRGSKQQIAFTHQTGICPIEQSNLHRILGIKIGPEMVMTDEGVEHTLALQVQFMKRATESGRANTDAYQTRMTNGLELKPAIFIETANEAVVEATHTHWANQNGKFVAYWQLMDQFILRRTDGTIAANATFKAPSAIPIIR